MTYEKDCEINEKILFLIHNALQEHRENVVSSDTSIKALLQEIQKLLQSKNFEFMSNKNFDTSISLDEHYNIQENNSKYLLSICLKNLQIDVHDKLKSFKFHKMESDTFPYDKFNINYNQNNLLQQKNLNFSFDIMMKILKLLNIYENNKNTREIKRKENNKNYNFEINRLFSFLEMKHDKSNILKMTTNGFYMNKSSICCAFCKLEIKLESHDCNEIIRLHHELAPECIIFSDMKNENIELARTLDFSLESHRRLSFAMTTWESHVSVDQLAKNGFRWSGRNDATRCSFCTLEIQGWQPGDDVLSEHKKSSPQCPLFSDMADGINNWQPEQELLIETVEFENKLKQLLDVFSDEKEKIIDLLLSRDINSNILDMDNIRHPEFTTLEARLATYATWPSNLSPNPIQLSEAGFYYTGYMDRVLCFCCNGGLKDWNSEDQPWVEHATWFPRCQYLIQQKGQYFVETVHRLINQNLLCELNRLLPLLRSNKIVRQLKEIPTINASNISKFKLTDITSNTKELKQCSKCQKEDKNCVLLPCAHLSTCITCAQQLVALKKYCPLCNIPCRAFVKVFLS